MFAGRARAIGRAVLMPGGPGIAIGVRAAGVPAVAQQAKAVMAVESPMKAAGIAPSIAQSIAPSIATGIDTNIPSIAPANLIPTATIAAKAVGYPGAAAARRAYYRSNPYSRKFMFRRW
jgi:hypothetical protein